MTTRPSWTSRHSLQGQQSSPSCPDRGPPWLPSPCPLPVRSLCWDLPREALPASQPGSDTAGRARATPAPGGPIVREKQTALTAGDLGLALGLHPRAGLFLEHSRIPLAVALSLALMRPRGQQRAAARRSGSSPQPTRTTGWGVGSSRGPLPGLPDRGLLLQRAQGLWEPRKV